MNYLSLFSGIGGFELGIQQAYETIRNTNVSEVRRREETTEGELQENGKGLHTISTEATIPITNRSNELFNPSTYEGQPTCIGFSEIDKYAIATYQKHFPTHHNYGDITKINADELPDFDLLVGGFPCQAFSIAGKRKGFEDTRGTLFFEIARILKAKQPRLFCLENVKGLLSHDNGQTFATIIQTLDELGYNLQWQVLNSKNHGVPQNRERVFVVGHLRGTSRPKVFPIGESDRRDNEEHGKRQRILANTLKARDFKGGGNLVGDTLQYKGLCDKLGVYASTQETNAIEVLSVLQKKIGTEAFAEWGFGILDSLQTEEVLQPILHGKGVRHKTSENESNVDDRPLPRKKDLSKESLLLLWKSKNRCSPQEPRLARQFTKELNESLSQLPQQTSSFRIRRLTPTEAERLQGFPDGWTIGSDTQRYKQCGNAVTVNVIKDIMERLLCDTTT